MRASARGVAVVLVVLLAGCGGDDGDNGGTTSTAAATTAATTTTATTTAETTTAQETTTTTASEETRQDAITVRGKVGDTLTLIGQYATGADGKPKRREKVKVALIGKRGPFSGFDVAEGHELIGYDLRVTNVGEIRFEDALPSGTLILEGGENGKPTSLISGSGKNPCDNPSLKLKPGESKKVCAAFDVPKSAKPLTFQYAVDSGYGDTGLWKLR